MKLIYLAGPYTHPDPVENVKRAVEYADRIFDPPRCIPIVPHLTLLWHFHTPRPIDQWYAYDLAILERCDALFRIPGASYGADNEVAYANGRGMPVFYNELLLNDWLTR